jgi:hypothetical protein
VKELQASSTWAHYLEDTWLIGTFENAQQCFNRIAAHLTKADSLLIVEIKKSSTYQGWLPPEAWTWLQQTGMNWALN